MISRAAIRAAHSAGIAGAGRHNAEWDDGGRSRLRRPGLQLQEDRPRRRHTRGPPRHMYHKQKVLHPNGLSADIRPSGAASAHAHAMRRHERQGLFPDPRWIEAECGATASVFPCFAARGERREARSALTAITPHHPPSPPPRPRPSAHPRLSILLAWPVTDDGADG